MQYLFISVCLFSTIAVALSQDSLLVSQDSTERRSVPETTPNDDSSAGCPAVDGTTYSVGELFSNGVYWFRCVEGKDGAPPTLLRSGCVSANGELASHGQTFRMKYYSFRCLVSPDGLVRRKPVGCITKDGRELTGGQTYSADGYVFECVLPNVEAEHRPIACIAPDGALIAKGETYALKNMMYECEMVGRLELRTRVLGCADEEGALLGHGCYWLNNKNNQFQFRHHCVKNSSSASGDFSVEVRSCKFSGENSNLEIKVGCYQRLTSGEYLTCKQDTGSGTVVIGFENNPTALDGLSNDPSSCAVPATMPDEEC